MGKKCPECPPPGAPGWMTTFADLMSLLLTFFVLLLSFAQLDIVKFKTMAGSMKDAFGVQKIQQINPKPTGEDMVAMEFNQEIVLVHLVEELRVVLEDMVDNGDAEIIEEETGFMVRFKDDVMFEKGQVSLKEEMEPIIQEIANLIMDMPNLIYVTGHTDNKPADPKSPYPTNWGISAARASSVVSFFQNQGNVDPRQLMARGMGEFEPIADNKSETGRSRNRRIEIFISRQTKTPQVVEKVVNPAAPPTNF